VDPKKIEAMHDWPRPKPLKSLHVFLGLMGAIIGILFRIMEILQLLSLPSLKRMVSFGLQLWIIPSNP
jgi:hypothetical protein